MTASSFWTLLLATALPWSASAQGKAPAALKTASDAKASTEVKDDSVWALAVTHHSISIQGKPLRYTATTGYMPMKDAKGTVIARLFFIAYTKDGVADPHQRPVTFAFNGGPGSSSIWLHMGAVGPRRVDLDDKGVAPAPPYHLTDNPNTWLDQTDLVFIDPVSTGYSRPEKGQDANQFHGYQNDLRSVGDFIRLYTTRYSRWASPKFILGESYGTTRAAGLSGYLQEHYDMYLNGIVLVSSVLNFETISFNEGNDQPYIFFLPTYAATAWYYHRLSPELQAKPLTELVAEATSFAQGAYAQALFKGASLSNTERDQVIARLHAFTSLPPEYLQRARMRVTSFQFFKQLLRDSNLVVGRYDSRFSGEAVDPLDNNAQYDPSDANISGVFVGTFNDYVRNELSFKIDINYTALASVWPWEMARDRYLNVAPTLQRAMVRNPYLHVWVVCGYYDLATPAMAAEYTVAHMGLTDRQRARLQLTYYEAGHMVYISKNTIGKLHDDATRFYRQVLGAP